jgi:hypothetical protein
MSPLTLFTLIGLGWAAVAGGVAAPKAARNITAGAFPCAAAPCTAVVSWVYGPNWRPASDSIRVVWREGSTVLRRVFTRGTADTLTIATTAAGEVRSGDVTVCVFRRGFSSPACALAAPWSVEVQDEPPTAVDSVTITPASVSLTAGKTQQFQAAVFSH